MFHNKKLYVCVKERRYCSCVDAEALGGLFLKTSKLFLLFFFVCFLHIKKDFYFFFAFGNIFVSHFQSSELPLLPIALSSHLLLPASTSSHTFNI